MDQFKELWDRYQLLDWAVLSVLLLSVAITTVAAAPHCRTFQWTDSTISYPMHDDTFPNYSLILMFVLSLGFVVLFIRVLLVPLRTALGEPLALYRLSARSDSAGHSGCVDITIRGPVYPWLKAITFAFCLQTIVTGFAKLYAGRLRPDYISRLAAAGFTATTPGLPDPQADPAYYCRLMKKHEALKEGRLSFPSGHSSSGFAVCTMVTFFLFAHLRPTARQGSFARLCISLLPLLVAFLCAISRTRDNKHHFSDILAGSIIGVVCAYVMFIMTFRETGGAESIYVARGMEEPGAARSVTVMASQGSPMTDYQAAEMTARPAAGADTSTSVMMPADPSSPVRRLNNSAGTVQWV